MHTRLHCSIYRCQMAFSLGNGSGYSVLEIVDAARQVTGLPIDVTMGPQRPGDSAILVADSTHAIHTLGWQPRFTGISAQIEHAWAWHCKQTAR